MSISCPEALNTYDAPGSANSFYPALSAVDALSRRAVARLAQSGGGQ